jgi:hypothetical protein
MKTSATNRRLRVLITALRDGKLIPRPDFQRRLVWSNKDKLYFLQTVLMSYPFPEIYVAAGTVNPDTGESTELLVDGQQRIATLYQYFSGSSELTLGGGISPYADLPQEQKLAFLEYEVVVRDLGSLEIDAIKDVFLRINSTNYAVNAMETHNARYDGAFKRFGEEIAELQFFEVHRLFSHNDVKRMQDLRYVLVLSVTLLSTYFHRDDAIEMYLEKFNDDFPDAGELRYELIAVLSVIDECGFPPGCRVWKKADLFTLIVELHRAMFRDGGVLEPSSVKDRLLPFYTMVDKGPDSFQMTLTAVLSSGEIDAVDVYYRASLQATNDRSNRIRRGEIIREIITGQLQV